jgi:hypothetical protein
MCLLKQTVAEGSPEDWRKMRLSEGHFYAIGAVGLKADEV